MLAAEDFKHMAAADGGPLRIRVRQNDDKFFAAESADNVAFAKILLHCLRSAAQHDIAGLMAERVIEAFEMIDVQHQHGEHCALALAARHFPRQRFLEEATVVESCQGIADGLLAQVFPQPDIAESQTDLI